MGSSGASSHFNLVKGRVGNQYFEFAVSPVAEGWKTRKLQNFNHARKKGVEKFSLSSHFTHQKLVHEFPVTYLCFRSCA
jgi:hypothetical protein